MHTCIHVGLHKTGTTWLQDILFPKLVEGSDWSLSSVSAKIPLAEVDDRLQRAVADSLAGRCSLLSCEDISGSIELDRDPDESWEAISRFMDNKAFNDPGCGVIIGFRRQESWLASAYTQKIKKSPYSITLNDYQERFSNMDLAWGEWAELIASKTARPFIYFLEEIREDPVSLARDLASYLDVSFPTKVQELSATRRNQAIESRLGLHVHRRVRTLGTSGAGRLLKKAVKHGTGGKVRLRYEGLAKLASGAAKHLDSYPIERWATLTEQRSIWCWEQLSLARERAENIRGREFSEELFGVRSS